MPRNQQVSQVCLANKQQSCNLNQNLSDCKVKLFSVYCDKEQVNNLRKRARVSAQTPALTVNCMCYLGTSEQYLKISSKLVYLMPLLWCVSDLELGPFPVTF